MNESVAKLALLDSVQYLYLRRITEPRDNTLRIVVQEAVANFRKAPTEIPGVPKSLLTGAAPIESTETCKTFVLYWPRYERISSLKNRLAPVETRKMRFSPLGSFVCTKNRICWSTSRATPGLTVNRIGTTKSFVSITSLTSSRRIRRKLTYLRAAIETA